jgi:VWFA-related protein
VTRAVVLAILPSLALWPQGQSVFRAEVDLVAVPCVVTDQRGVAVTGLGREDFRVYDNGVRQDIRNLWLDKDVPLALGAIVDVSESQSRWIAAHRADVDRFLDRILRPRDRAFVVEVNRNVILRSELIGSAHGVGHVLAVGAGEPLGEPCPTLRGRSLCGGTALWNAVYAAAHWKLRSLQGSKALLILSDGDDTGSTHSLNQAVEEAQGSDAIVYAIRYSNSATAPSTTQPADGLSRLAGETGGVVFDPPGTGYGEILSRIEADLRSRYILGFHPSATGNPRHQLNVEVTRPGLTVRARQEYFDAR